MSVARASCPRFARSRGQDARATFRSQISLAVDLHVRDARAIGQPFAVFEISALFALLSRASRLRVRHARVTSAAVSRDARVQPLPALAGRVFAGPGGAGLWRCRTRWPGGLSWR